MTSALDGWVDICRTGTWTGTNGKTVTVDTKHFDELVSAYATQDPAPIVVGHPDVDSPAYGWVEKIRRVGDRLQMKARNLMPEFRTAVEAGHYTGRSLATAQGKLRHIGFLGGRAPAVPGLSPTQFASEPEMVVELAEGDLSTRQGTRFLARVVSGILRSLRDQTIDEQGIEAADRLFPSWDIDHASSIANDLKGDEPVSDTSPIFSDPTPTTEDYPLKKPVPASTPDAAALAAKEKAIEKREAALTKRETDLLAAEHLSVCDAALEPHVSAGRILPGERAGIAALLASLPTDDASAVTFASAEDDRAEITQKPHEILDALFAALPKRVEYPELGGGPMPPNNQSSKDAAFAVPADTANVTIDEGQMATHGRIMEFAAQNGITYRAALLRVAKVGTT